VGLGLRLYNLSEESLWLDEALSVTRAQQDLGELIETVRGVKGNPPLHYLLLHVWIKWWGSSEWAVRSLSVLFGMVGIYMLYRVGVLLFDKTAGILGALFMALSSYHIFFAQEARGYTQMAMLALFSMYFFIKLLQKPGWLLYLAYIMVSSALIYTHYYGALIIVAQNIHIIIMALVSRNLIHLKLTRWFLLQLVLGVTFIPWIMVLLGRIAEIQKIDMLWNPSLLDLPGSLKAFVGDNMIIGLFFILMAAAAFVTFERNRPEPGKNILFRTVRIFGRNIHITWSGPVILLLLWLLVSLIVPFIVSKVSTPIFHQRYMIGASAAFFLLAARGITHINRKSVTIICVIIIIIFCPLQTLSDYGEVNKEPWREVAQLIENDARGDEVVLINASYCMIPYEYYAQRPELNILPFPSRGKDINQDNIRQLDQIMQKYDKIWLVLSHQGKNIDLLINTLKNSHQPIRHWKFFRIEVMLYQKNLSE
jgi:mannosyltransferase